MTSSIAGILTIVIYFALGKVLAQLGVLQNREIVAIKKIVLTIALPPMLFLSFSQLNLELSHIPVTLVVFSLNAVLFFIGVLIFRMKGKSARLVPLIMCSMNFSLVGIPLFVSLFSMERLHHYVILGVGHELFFWFAFYTLFSRILVKEKTGHSPGSALVRSPIAWGILLGCIASIAGFDLSQGTTALSMGIFASLEGLSALAGPLILIYIGSLFSVEKTVVKQSLQLIAIRLVGMFSLGYLLKFLIVDHFIPPSNYADAAWFLLMSLPPVFALPMIAADYLDDRENNVLGNMIVLQVPITAVLFFTYRLLMS
jgi:predicted permease